MDICIHSLQITWIGLDFLLSRVLPSCTLLVPGCLAGYNNPTPSWESPYY